MRVLGTALSSGLMARFDYEMILTKMMMMMTIVKMKMNTMTKSQCSGLEGGNFTFQLALPLPSQLDW